MIKSSKFGYPVYVNPENHISTGFASMEVLIVCAGLMTLTFNLLNLL